MTCEAKPLKLKQATTKSEENMEFFNLLNRFKKLLWPNFLGVSFFEAYFQYNCESCIQKTFMKMDVGALKD